MSAKEKYERITNPNEVESLYKYYNTPSLFPPWIPEFHFSQNIQYANYGIDDAQFKQMMKAVSLGGVRGLNKDNATTMLRKVKRLCLLLHRMVWCYSHDETRDFRDLIKNLNIDQMRVLLRELLPQGCENMPPDLKTWMETTVSYEKGDVVTIYEQSDDIGILNDNPQINRGWCFGMAVMWLWCASERTKFWKGMVNGSHPMTAEFTELMRIQNIYVRDYRLGRVEKISRILDEVDLFPEGQPLKGHLRNKMGEAVVAQGRGDYRYIGQNYHNGGGHAMAACLCPQVRFMDPNGGEVRFGDINRLGRWLPRYLRFKKYHISAFEVVRMRRQN